MLGVSVVLPAEHRLVDRNIARSYGWFGEVFAGWLRGAGVNARLVAQPLAAGELRWACFAGLSHGEVVVDDRKLVGLAQARRRPGTLFAAGLLVARTPWELLCDVMGQPAEHAPLLAARTASCAELLGALDVAAAARELEARLAAAIA
jgi:lipoate-protein ligase A